MSDHYPYLFCIVALTASSLLRAEPEVAPDFGFGSPEVIKLDWSTRSLTATDLNADGLRDLAVINNDTAKIELLYQLALGAAAPERKKTVNRSRWEPVLEDALFEKRGLTVGFPVFDLAAHDLNGDGRVDLAYTSGEVPLTVRYQNEDEEWVDSQEFDGFEALGWMNSIKIADTNGDGLAEIYVLSADAVRVFRQTAEGELSEPDLFYISGENPFNLMLFDATGDGLQDLLYLSRDGKQILAMREQVADGQFGPESRFTLERTARTVVPLGAVGDEAPALGMVNSRSGALEFLRLAARPGEVDPARSALAGREPEIYPIFKQAREPAAYTLGDVDGDGHQDLIVANPAKAALVLFTRMADRFQASDEFPSFSAASSLAAGRFHQQAQETVIVLSEAEKTVGRSTLDARGRLTFPRQIEIAAGDPVALSAFDLNGDDYDELALIYQDQGDYRLVVAAPADRQAQAGSWDVLFDMELAGVRRKPTAITSLDCFELGSPGLIIFVPREPPVLLRPDDSAHGLAFKAVATESSIRESLFKALTPAEVSVFDVDGEGANELVVARTGFARAFRIAGDRLEMVDQFNARRGSDEITAVIPIKSDSGISAIALYVGGAGEIQLLRPDATGVFRYEQSRQVGRLELQNWYRLPAAKSEEADGFLLAGKDRFWYFGPADAGPSWVVEDIYETDLEDIHYTHLAAADFDADQKTELVALDGSAHVIDVLSSHDGSLRSRMFWQIFEQNMHYQGRTGAKLEPREILIDDFTGDGLPDLTLLVHDRVLIYPQE